MGGHRIPYRGYIVGSTRVLIQDACPCGLPETLTSAHMLGRLVCGVWVFLSGVCCVVCKVTTRVQLGMCAQAMCIYRHANVHLSACLSVCRSIYLPVYLST